MTERAQNSYPKYFEDSKKNWYKFIIFEDQNQYFSRK